MVVTIIVSRINRELGALHTQTVEAEATLLRASGRTPDLVVQLPTIYCILELDGTDVGSPSSKTSDKTIREKRGLFNLGGKAATFFFGVAAEDVQKLENSMTALRYQVGSVIHLQEDHSLLTR